MTEARKAAQHRLTGALEPGQSRTGRKIKQVRNQAQAHADGHDRPPGSYLMITDAYWAVVAGTVGDKRVPPARPFPVAGYKRRV